jgi:hypothetical protein
MVTFVAPRREVLLFSGDDVTEVVTAMTQLADAHRGWINLHPEIVEQEDEDPPTGGFFGVFSGRGPEVPLCTWAAGEVRRRGPDQPSIGVQHGTGPKVVDRLRELGHPVPTEWTVAQDHPRRGLVVSIPTDEPHGRVLEWLLAAGRLLCPRPLTGRWSAEVFSP